MKKEIIIASALLLVGAGCSSGPQAPAPSPAQQPPAATTTPSVPTPAYQTWVHPTYGFSFQIPSGTVAKISKDGGVTFSSPSGTQYAVMIVMQEIPRVPLPDDKIDSVMLDGQTAKVYHDRDAKTGTEKIDKLITDIPNSENDMYLAVTQKYDAFINLSNIIKTWQW